MTKEKIKHLEFIQNVITRMNKNSFQLKGWTITIVSAILAIYVSTKNCYFVLSGIFPTVIFWFLDAYYLTQERKFQGLYNDVAEIPEIPKQIKLFVMRSDLYTKGKYSFWNALWSRTIWMLYLSIIIMLIVIFIYY
jgi:hypothetical protein